MQHSTEPARRPAGSATSVGTRHLLAGIVSVSDSMASEILRRLGVRAADVRAALAETLGVEPERLGCPHRRRRRLLTTNR
jgi:hypothetical protein